MAPPEFSVIIPVKNRSRMLGDCLRGLAAQSAGAGAFEVIIVDNCSSEDLAPVAAAGRALGLDVHLLRTPRDRGPAPARNLGVSAARGAILAFTDSDCRPSRDWLAQAREAFASGISMASGPVLSKPEQAARWTSKLSFVTEREHPTFPTANLFMLRSVFTAHRGFDESLSFKDPFDRATECADTDLAWRIIKSGHRRAFLDDAIVHHEVEDQGVLLWILEGTRLFILPALVRRHPELRRSLLTARLFFYPPAVLIYVALVLGLAAIAVEPRIAFAIPVLLLARGMQRTRSLDPVALLRYCGRTLLHLPRMLVMTAALLYGSVRFRTLVL